MSTLSQSLDLQKEALRKVGVEDFRMFYDKETGADIEREGLKTLLMKVEPGDIINVTRTDRLGRNSLDMCNIIEHIKKIGVLIRFIQQGITTEGTVGEMVVKILTAVADVDRQDILERTNAGRVAAMAKGVKFGRKPSIDRAKVMELKNSGVNICQIARQLKINRRSVYRILDENKE